MSVSVLAKQKNKLYVTDCHSYSLWFERFSTGMQTRIIGEVRQDKAVSVELVKELVKDLEEDHLTTLSLKEK